MTARFILSFDCEGQWGVADALGSPHSRALTDERLGEAYRQILDILDEHELSATFAFVGAFTQSPAAFARVRPQLEMLAGHASAYLGSALAVAGNSRAEGWHGERLVASVANSRVGHEVALHGVTHVPWTAVDRGFVQAEMELLRELEGPIRDSRTFVFPRNLVAHAEVLGEHGFAGYRTAPPQRSRFASLLSEFNVNERPERALASEGIVGIPAGFFLNWRSGPRKLVPASVTQLRVKRLLERAAAEGGIVHYWLHPENVASAPSTIDLVRMLAREVATAREAGRCEVMTQLGYCEWAESLR